MTLDAYRKATKILEEVDLLEEKRDSLDPEMDSEKYIEVCNKLFELGQEFARL